MNSGTIIMWKEIGETPLQAIERLRQSEERLKGQAVSYAGRLDPMAEGILLLLVGEENKKRVAYQGLEKEYEAEIVLGIATDTFDALGIITGVADSPSFTKEVGKVVLRQKEKTMQEYPPFSSKTVNGKPLYWYARNNLLNTVVLPKRPIIVRSIEIIDYEEVVAKKLLRVVSDKLTRVSGNFRQDEILAEWKRHLGERSKSFLKLRVKIKCSSGTYVRRIASDIGEELGVGAVALSIKRTKIGEFSESDITLPRES